MSRTELPGDIEGSCEADFGAIPELLARQLGTGEHHGVAVAVRHRGEPVVDVWGGMRTSRTGEEMPWAEDTMAVSFSTTKGPAATALHMVLERAGVDYDVPVCSLWPEFRKPSVTVRHVLCHEAGVPQIRDEVADVTAMADWEAMVRMMERLEPLWEPGTANGYHAVNFGWMVGELVKRIDGRDIATFVAEELAGPLGLDGFVIGTPDSEQHRVALLERAKVRVAAESFASKIKAGSLTAMALGPRGDMVKFLNSPQGMASCGPSFSGAFTARSLAALYSALERGGELGGARILSPGAVARAAEVQNTRRDLVLLVPMGWRLGFMGGGRPESPMGPNREAFGHAGWGGSLALADPRAELSVAVVLDRMVADLLAGERTIAVVREALRASEDAQGPRST